ncbi:hypothetical protein IM543_03040 [Massilia sp. UMI-21]|nr:hypothetical protein IM543_03040 [Massilia sp. UMI-21]
MRRGWRPRAGTGACILLAHLVLLAVVIRYAGIPSAREEAPDAVYMALTLVPERTAPRLPEPALSAPSPPLRRHRDRVVRRQDAAAPAPVETPTLARPGPQDATAERRAAQPRRLDMEALRAAARDVEREDGRSASERLRAAEQLRSEDDSPLARGIRRAKRPDCQTAYAGDSPKADLFILVPLVLDTIRDKGCKW